MITRGIRNRNPFNIRHNANNKWLGEMPCPDDKGFCRFFMQDYGLRAGLILLRNYVDKKHLTSADSIIKRFAPSSENDTAKYIKFVESWIFKKGFNPYEIAWRSPSFFELANAIVYYESKLIYDLRLTANKFSL